MKEIQGSGPDSPYWIAKWQPLSTAMRFRQFLGYLIDVGASQLDIVADRAPSIVVAGRIHQITEDSIIDTEIDKILKYVAVDGWAKALAAQGTLRWTKAISPPMGEAIGIEFTVSRVFTSVLFDDRQDRSYSLRVRLPHRIVPAIDSLDIPRRLREELLTVPPGIVMISGAPWSGRATLMASIMQAIGMERHRSIRVAEYSPFLSYPQNQWLSSGIVSIQHEIPQHLPDWGAAVDHARRTGVTHAFFGDCPDAFVLARVCELANAGVVVFVRMAGGSAVQTVQDLARLVGMAPADERLALTSGLAMNLNMIVSQRVIPRTGPASGSIVTLRDHAHVTGEMRLRFRQNPVIDWPQIFDHCRNLSGETWVQILAEAEQAGQIDRRTVAVLCADEFHAGRTRLAYLDRLQSPKPAQPASRSRPKSSRKPPASGPKGSCAP